MRRTKMEIDALSRQIEQKITEKRKAKFDKNFNNLKKDVKAGLFRRYLGFTDAFKEVQKALEKFELANPEVFNVHLAFFKKTQDELLMASIGAFDLPDLKVSKLTSQEINNIKDAIVLSQDEGAEIIINKIVQQYE
jgi:hypothetical protein